MVIPLERDPECEECDYKGDYDSYEREESQEVKAEYAVDRCGINS